jgi:hypothetical protein
MAVWGRRQRERFWFWPEATRAPLVLAGGELPAIRKVEVQNVFSQVVWPNLIIWAKTL